MWLAIFSTFCLLSSSSKGPIEHISVRAAPSSSNPRRSEPPFCACAVLFCCGLAYLVLCSDTPVLESGYSPRSKEAKCAPANSTLPGLRLVSYTPRPGHRACLQIPSVLGKRWSSKTSAGRRVFSLFFLSKCGAPLFLNKVLGPGCFGGGGGGAPFLSSLPPLVTSQTSSRPGETCATSSTLLQSCRAQSPHENTQSSAIPPHPSHGFVACHSGPRARSATTPQLRHKLR